jgi:hypothetical protein
LGGADVQILDIDAHLYKYNIRLSESVGRGRFELSPSLMQLGLLREMINTAGTFKKTITSLVLCCVLVDPVVATLTWLYYQKTIVKKEVNRQILAGIDEEDLVLLKFSKSEVRTKLRWEHPKEFEYNRRMYDVVETMTLGDTVYYWCWFDHKETELNRRLEELAAQAMGKKNKIRKKAERFFSFFKSLYCNISFSWNGAIPELLSRQFCLFSEFYASVAIQPPTPPPQLS